MILTYKDKTPQIHPDAFVAPNATVIGNAVLEKDCSVWFGAVIRADMEKIEIGEGSNVQDNATLHADEGKPAILGKNVTVGHNAVVHGCTVGDNTVIGMQATVLNGALIGKNCIIGAGAVVKENMEIPDNSLVVGVPAKVIRTLETNDAQIANAEEYVELAEQYRKIC